MRRDEQKSDMRREELGEIAFWIEAPAFVAALRISGAHASKDPRLIPGDPALGPSGQGNLKGFLQGCRKSAEAIVPGAIPGRAELKEMDIR
jgi:hypothetical protein